MSIDMNKMPKIGFGLMRLPENDGVIDIDKVSKMADSYLEAGFTYFDTAYVYHGGNSEKAVKEAIVKRHPRDSFTLATKLPAWFIHSLEDRDKLFNEQLDRCGVDFFDFYLLHSIEDGNNYEIYEKYDCFNWGIQKKAEGKIRHFGFSYHGTPELLVQILDKHPEVEFVQIQLNYIDWDNPIVHSGELYKILSERNIPIIVMEPCKGGTLVRIPPEAEALLKACAPEASAASWALRFAAGQPGVIRVLSGMNSLEQVEENCAVFRELRPLSAEENAVIRKVAALLNANTAIPCTACEYCVHGCPMKIAIPQYFALYNSLKRTTGSWSSQRVYFNNLVLAGHGKPGACIKCGRCERACPQHLPIRCYLEEVAGTFESGNAYPTRWKT